MENPPDPFFQLPLPPQGADSDYPQHRPSHRDRPVAVVDIGSNSVRMVVYEHLARSPTPYFNEKVLAGLGSAVAATGDLSHEAIATALGAFRRFCALAGLMDVGERHIIATAAVREAANGQEFLDQAEEIFGQPVTILSAAQESYLSALGVVAGVTHPDGVMGDLGGGSLELAELSLESIANCESYPLGGLRLQVASGGSIKTAKAIARQSLERSQALERLQGRDFYMVGGTWRSLARLHMEKTGYPLHVMHEYRIDAGGLKEFIKWLTKTPVDDLPGIEVVSRQRRPLLANGAIVLGEIARRGRPRSLIVSALGVREGMLFSKLSGSERSADPLLQAAGELADLRARSPEHGEELVAWAEQAMTALGLDETVMETRLRKAACLLADIGWRAHPDYRGAQSLNIIANAAFVGVDHPGRAYLALAVYYRHSGLSLSDLGAGLSQLAPARYHERARALAAIFRVSYLVSASTAGVLPRTRLERGGDNLVLLLPEDLSALAGGRLEIRLRQLAELVGLTACIEIKPAIS